MGVELCDAHMVLTGTDRVKRVVLATDGWVAPRFGHPLPGAVGPHPVRAVASDAPAGLGSGRARTGGRQ
ncbi:hypothetical protein ASD51_26400 [Streptomyces sp. Root55]|nr:hypothetical protein ASD51_26400 [Streptomyces sp. Root55]